MRIGRKQSIFDRFLAQILIAPSTLIIFGVLLLPILFALYMSLNKLSFQQSTTVYDFVGLKNYVDIFTNDPWFYNSIGLTIVFTVLTVAAEIMLGVAIALVLNKQFKGRGFVRGLMILPWALPTVVNAIMWKWIFNANYGALNAALFQAGAIGEYQVWMGDPVSAFICVLVANIWKETPYVVLLTIAALATIPGDLYESANIDGAGGWRAFWKITLPLIKPVILILTITKTIWALQTFDLVYIMTGGGPMSGTEFITYYIQKVAFKFNKFGNASAMSYMLSMVCFFLTLGYIKLFMGKDNKEDKLAWKHRREQRRLAK